MSTRERVLKAINEFAGAVVEFALDVDNVTEEVMDAKRDAVLALIERAMIEPVYKPSLEVCIALERLNALVEDNVERIAPGHESEKDRAAMKSVRDFFHGGERATEEPAVTEWLDSIVDAATGQKALREIAEDLQGDHQSFGGRGDQLDRLRAIIARAALADDPTEAQRETDNG